MARPTQPGIATGRSGHAAWALALIVAAVVAYIPSFSGVFLFDDIRTIVENPHLRQLWPPWSMLDPSRPLVELSLKLNYAIGGLRVGGYHLFNLLVHVCAGLTLFGLVRRSMVWRDPSGASDRRAMCIAGAAALVWLVHPLNTQAVTYVIQRSESMMALSYLFMLYAIVRAAEARRDSAREAVWAWSTIAVLVCAAGMACKAVMVTAPIVAILFDRCVLGTGWKDIWKLRGVMYAGLAASWLVLGWLGVFRGTFDTQMAGAEVGFGVTKMTPGAYAMTQPGVILHYLRLAVWPHPLCLDYAWRPVAGIGEAASAVAGLVGLLAASVWLIWRCPAAGFAAAGFFIVIAPTSSFVPIKDLAMEHRVYLPLAAVVVLAVLGVDAVLRRFALSVAGKAIGGALIVVVATAMTAQTIRRNFDYQSGLTMWGSVVSLRPENPRARNNYGNALVAAGYREDGVEEFETALRLNPDIAKVHLSLGVALAEMGRTNQARRHYEEAIRLRPDYAKAHNSVGLLLAKEKKWTEAIRAFEAAIAARPDNADGHYNLGLALASSGQAARAVDCYREALRLRPDKAAWRNNLAAVLAQSGRRAEAIGELQQVIREAPDHFMASFNLGVLLEQDGRPAEAAEAYRRALRIRPGDEVASKRLRAIEPKASEPSP